MELGSEGLNSFNNSQLTPQKKSLKLISPNLNLQRSPSSSNSTSNSDDDILDETYSFFNSSSQSSTSSDVHTLNHCCFPSGLSSESIKSLKKDMSTPVNFKSIQPTFDQLIRSAPPQNSASNQSLLNNNNTSFTSSNSFNHSNSFNRHLNSLRQPPEPSASPPPSQRPRKIVSIDRLPFRNRSTTINNTSNRSILPFSPSDRANRRSSLRSNNSDNAIQNIKRPSKKHNSNPPNSVAAPQRVRNVFPSPEPPTRASFPLQPASYASARPLQAAFQAPSTLMSKSSKSFRDSNIGISGSPACMPDTPAKPSAFSAKAQSQLPQSMPAQSKDSRSRSFFSKSAKRVSMNLALAASSPSKENENQNENTNNNGRGRGRMAILRRSSALSLGSNRTGASSDSDGSPCAKKYSPVAEDECLTPRCRFFESSNSNNVNTNSGTNFNNTNSPTPSSKVTTPTLKSSRLSRRASQLFDRSSNPLSSSPEPSIGSSPTSPKRPSLFSSLRSSKDKTRSMSSFIRRRSSSKLSISSKAQENEDFTGKFEKEFCVLSELGKGEFSEAFIVCKREESFNGKLYAIKRGKPFEGERDRQRQLNEPVTLSKLPDHPNIIKLVDYWEENNRLYIQTELCEKGGLNHFLDDYGMRFAKLDETRVWKILGDIANGVKFLHSCGIWHLDLKPANIFVTSDGTLRIGDFGLAVQESQLKNSCNYKNIQSKRRSTTSDHDGDKCLNALSLSTVIESEMDDDGEISLYAGDLEREGDREYLAPEILRGNYSHAADIFSLGLIILEAACNIVLPGNGEPWQKLRSLDFSECPFDNLSLALVELIRAMLDPNPENRPTAHQILQHQILANVINNKTCGATEVEIDKEFLENIVAKLSNPPSMQPQASLIVQDESDECLSRKKSDDFMEIDDGNN